MATDAQRRAIVGYLDEYCFQSIWNSVHSEYRGNFQLTSVNARLQTSAFAFDNSVIGLPSGGSYRVFRFAKSLLNGSFELPTSQSKWYSLVDIATVEGVKLSVYDIEGHLTPMAQTYVFLPTGADIGFLIIQSDALVASIPDGLNVDLFMTVFKNPRDTDAPWSISSRKLVKLTDADTDIAIAKAAPAGQGFAVLNGISYPDLTQLPKLKIGDYIDVGVDPTVYVEYVVQIDDTDKGYLSTKYSGHRKILHCPKALNPNQWLLTHDGATVFVRNVDTKESVYFHRVDPVSIKQITHNDLSASYMTLLSFKNALNATQVEVVVRVRAHEIKRVLMSESAWIADLYLCDDDLIVDNLRGDTDETLTFWSAASLEDSGYINLMFNDPYSIDTKRLDTYVNALGYYSTAAILSTSVYFGTYQNADLFVEKSFAQIGKTTTPFVYNNGIKIPQSHVTSSDYDTNHVGITIDKDYPISAGTAVQIHLLDAGDPTPTVFVPSADTPTLTIPSTVFSVYTKTDDTPVQGWKRTSSAGYVYTPPGYRTYAVVNNDDGTATLTFAAGMYGKTILVPPSRFCWKETYNLDDLIANFEPFIFPVQVEAADGSLLPVLGYGNVSVYLNGRYLVRDVDYKLDPVYGANSGGVMLLDLIVNCRSYFDPKGTGNQLEVYITTDRSPSTDVGYVTDNILARTDVVSFWYPQVSVCHAEGVLQTNLLDNAVYMMSMNPLQNGNLFELKPVYPEIVAEMLSDYSSVGDERTISAINTYLGRMRPSPGDLVTLSMEHKLYSTYITAILHDLVNGIIVIKDDPNEATFLSQFADYDYLRDRDPTLTDNDTRVDRGYLSIAAAYTQFPPMTATQTRLVQKLIGLTLITSNATIGETLI